MKSPHSISIGRDLTSYSNLLASKYVFSCINGSITHMLLLYDHLKDLSHHLTSIYPDWHFRMLLLESTIIIRNKNDLNGLLKRYDDILCKMNAEDAKKVYEFSSNSPIEHYKFISNLEAFKAVGYFLSDNDFITIWNDLFNRIKNWLSCENPNVTIGDRLFSALSENVLRIDINELVEICCITIERDYGRFYDDMFKIFTKPIDLSRLVEKNSLRLIDNIISIIINKEKRQTINSFKSAVITLRKKNAFMTKLFDDVIKDNMPEFYYDTYEIDVFIKDGKLDVSSYLQKELKIIQNRNSTQGENGVFRSYASDPINTIRYLIENSIFTFSNDQINSILNITTETLLNTKLSVQEKSNSIKLIITLSRRYKNALFSNNGLIEKLKKSENEITSCNDMFTNLTENTIRLCYQFLIYCFGLGNWSTLMEIFSDIKDDEPALIHASSFVSHFLEQYSSNELDSEVVSLILQNSLLWCREENVDIRWHAIYNLLLLAGDLRCSSVVCNQLVRAIDTDNVYIKNRISWHINKIKSIDKSTYDYILQKALLDTNYVVRMRYSNLESDD